MSVDLWHTRASNHVNSVRHGQDALLRHLVDQLILLIDFCLFGLAETVLRVGAYL